MYRYVVSDLAPPPVAPSPYVLYCQATRPGLKAQFPSASFGEFGILLGEGWAALSDEQKQSYRAEHAKLKKAADQWRADNKPKHRKQKAKTRPISTATATSSAAPAPAPAPSATAGTGSGGSGADTITATTEESNLFATPPGGLFAASTAPATATATAAPFVFSAGVVSNPPESESAPPNQPPADGTDNSDGGSTTAHAKRKGINISVCLVCLSGLSVCFAVVCTPTESDLMLFLSCL